MNNYNNDSLLEIAVRLMRSKKKPKALKDLTNEVFQAKGITKDENIEEKKAQFQVDFMVSGYFVCCGENKKGFKLWDLKNRQPSSLLDKDGNYLEDLYADDEDVIKNELKDDYDYHKDIDKSIDTLIDDDEEEDDDENETDDIEEELGLVRVEDEEDEEDEVIATTEIIIDDEEDDDDDIEEDDIEEELNK